MSDTTARRRAATNDRWRGPVAASWRRRAATLAVVGATVAACTPPDGPFAGPRRSAPDTLVMNIFAEPETVDPGVLFGHPDGVLARQLFAPLFETDPVTLAPTPALATSMTTSDDGRTLRFTLRDDARWSNGEPVTAFDVVGSWERVLRPATAARGVAPLFVIENARLYLEGRIRRLAGDDVRPRRAPFVLFGDDALDVPPIGVFPPRAKVELVDSNVRAPRGADVALRLEPDAGAPVLSTLSPGRPALVLAKKSERGVAWVQVRPDEGSRAAWARESELRPVFPAVDLRAVEGERVYGLKRAVRATDRVDGPVAFFVEDDAELEVLAEDEVVARVRDPESGRAGYVPADALDDVTGDRVWFVARVQGDEGGAFVREGWVPARDLVVDASVLGVRAEDAHTVEVRLERATPYFASLLSLPALRPVPLATIDAWGTAWTRPAHIVTSGAFHLAEARARDRFVLERSATYWDRARVALARVELLIVHDEHTAISLYRAGFLDAMLAAKIPVELVPGLRGRPDYVAAPAFATYYTKLNTTRPALHDARVRRALAMAIDRRALTEHLLGAGQEPATHVVPPGLPGYPVVEGPSFDVAAARALLAEAGYPDGVGFPRLRYLFNTSEHHRVVAEFLQAQWREHLHVDVELENQEWKTYLRRLRDRDYDLARSGWIGDYLDAASFLEEFLSDAPNNETGWASPRFDVLFHDAARTLDGADRARLLADAERLLAVESPVIPIFFYVNNALLAPGVTGYAMNLLDQHPLKDVRIVDVTAGGAP